MNERHADRPMGDTKRGRGRRTNPATSAKILVTGLSATAMLGMTAGYSLAQDQETGTPVTSTLPLEQGTPSPAPSTPSAVTAPATTAPASNEIIVVPVEPVAPATPGGNFFDPWNQQDSGGSQ